MPAAGAAGVAAATARRKRMEKRHKEDLEVLDQWFATYDTSHTGAFERAEMQAFLTQIKREVCHDNAAVVKDDLLDKIMKKYGKDRGASGLGVERADALNAVKRYKMWLKYERHFESLFAKADVDSSGRLSREQLKKLLQQVAIENGISPVIKREDIEFVLDQVDEEVRGELTLEEAGPAVAKWCEIMATAAPPATIFNLCCGGGKKKKVSPHNP